MTLDPDLARRLKAAARKAADGTSERDRLIIEAWDAGASQREIAAAVGLSHTAVWKIEQRARKGGERR